MMDSNFHVLRHEKYCVENIQTLTTSRVGHYSLFFLFDDDRAFLQEILY